MIEGIAIVMGLITLVMLNQMQGVKALVDTTTLDESPGAYKNIFEVMELQKDLVEVVVHVKPIINVKG